MKYKTIDEQLIHDRAHNEGFWEGRSLETENLNKGWPKIPWYRRIQIALYPDRIGEKIIMYRKTK